MPIYEYQCRACGHQFEVLQRLSDAPITDCGSCEDPEVQKMISAVAFRLKGTGWYETDFKNNNRQKAEKSDTAPDSNGNSSDTSQPSKTESDSASESTKKSDSTDSSKTATQTAN